RAGNADGVGAHEKTPLTRSQSGLSAAFQVPPAGFEPAHTAPEAVALSPELRGRFAVSTVAGPLSGLHGLDRLPHRSSRGRRAGTLVSRPGHKRRDAYWWSTTMR